MKKKLLCLILMTLLAAVSLPVSPVYAEEAAADMEETGSWKLIKDKWYYILNDKSTASGWILSKGRWYYLNPDGAMQTGWKKLNGRWYYLNRNGAMQTGWKKISGRWYFFNSSGAMAAGWLKWKGSWYYMSEQNGMQEDRIICSKGIYYYLDKDGICRDLEDQLAAGVAAEMDGDLARAIEYAWETAYYGKELFGDTMTSVELAEYGIRNRQGNCYVRAAVFREIAVCMGYDAHQVSGYVKVKDGWARHSWVEIEKAGTVWACDPTPYKQLGLDKSLMFTYGTPGTYIYSGMQRMN